MRRAGVAWALILPSSLWLILFFVVPLLLMAVFSLRPDMRGGLFSPWTPSLDQYRKAMGNPAFLSLLGTSVQMAAAVALVSAMLAYPVAYFLVFIAKLRAPFLLTLLILPFWTSYLLRVVAWKLILGSTGIINSLLIYLGLVESPVPLLLYSRTAVVITLIYVWIPFVALPIYAALQRIDRSLLEAAANLGASPLRVFTRVTLPLSMPGVVAGFLMVFIPTVGEYVTPLLVGGTRGSMYGNIIETFFGDGINWPLGSAMAVIMLVGTLLLVGLVARVVALSRILE